MYQSFFGLKERPFDLTPNPRYLVLTGPHREVLSTLQYGMASRTGITLLIGEAGSGKTTLIRAAMQRQPVRVHCVHLNNPTLTREEFVETLAVRFGLSERAAQSKAVLLRELEALLRERSAADETTVLIIDEAQSLPLDLLEEIRLLANIETEERKLLSVILAGQPELAVRLNEQVLRQLKQRVALRCDLRPLTGEEAASYIAGRIQTAGGTGASVFSQEAVAAIHEHARGIPRTMSVIADNALLGGFAAGQRPVSSQIVREVCRDFALTSAPEPPPSPNGEVALQMPPLGPAALNLDALKARLADRVGDAPGTGADGPADGPVFGSFSARRKRFSFFWS